VVDVLEAFSNQRAAFSSGGQTRAPGKNQNGWAFRR
jgi:hypothetical protein